MTTLTFNQATSTSQSGNTDAAFFNDLNSLITSKASDANFKWQVASFNSATSPYYLVLSRKDASAGRILYVDYTTAPAGNNSTIFDTAPSGSALIIAWFPNGTANTPTNLTASSGTIMGNDTGVIKGVSGDATIVNSYPSTSSGSRISYLDSQEMFVLHFGPPSLPYYQQILVTGKCIVDYSGNAYDASWSNYLFPTTGGSLMTWTPHGSGPLAPAPAVCRTNYGSTDRKYFCAWDLQPWAFQLAGSLDDILQNVSTTQAWFCPVQLMGQTKGEGIVLKLRQTAIGPTSVAPYPVFNITGPTVDAFQLTNDSTGSGTGYFLPWFVNFVV